MPNQQTSKKHPEKEGLITAFFFLCAVLCLIFLKGDGLLTYPGIIAGLVGIYFAWKSRYEITAFLGIVSASTSFIGQAITFFCSYCSLSAFIFLMAGLISLFKIYNFKPLYSLGLVILLTFSTTYFMLDAKFEDSRNPVIKGEIATIYKESENNQPQTEQQTKNRLYVTTTCKGCKDILPLFANKDPKGVYWEPVIVPHSSLHEGKQMLKEFGYQGEAVYSASNPPTNRVPCLQTPEGEILVGKDLKNFLEKNFKKE